MIRVPVPARVGSYQVALFAVTSPSCSVNSPYQPEAPARAHPPESRPPPRSSFQLIVESANGSVADRDCTAFLHAVHRALAEAECKQALPTDYLDVTHGFLAKFKRWLKGKLLGNFKRGYIDILSRQQSAFNRQTVSALQELAEYCHLLDQTLAETRRRLAALEARLAPTAERQHMGERADEVVRCE